MNVATDNHRRGPIDELAATELVDGIFRVHQTLGPGMLEAAYEACLVFDLLSRGLRVERQLPVPIEYRGEIVPTAFRLDLLVERHIIVELKSVEKMNALHTAQILTYLRLTRHPVGFLVNFNVLRIKDGLKRFLL